MLSLADLSESWRPKDQQPLRSTAHSDFRSFLLEEAPSSQLLALVLGLGSASLSLGLCALDATS